MEWITLKELLEKDIAHGGKLVAAFGKPGSGKTGLLLGIANRLCPYELCIFRGLQTGQEFRFPGDVKILAYQCNPKFYDGGGDLIDIGVKHVNNFNDILIQAELDKLNTLYMPFENERKYWVEFARFLVHGLPFVYPSAYVSLFVDEVEDIVPFQEPGATREMKQFVAQMKEFRKCLTSIYCATQQYFDLDYRALGKFQYRIYLQGARVPMRERFSQELVDGLSLGQGVMTGSFFGKFVFGDYPTKKIVVVR